MASIEFSSVGKSYGDVNVIQDLNLHILDKEFMVFVGPSGCGKTTALRMIAGLESITQGDLLFDGKVVNKLPPRDRDVAMVFQSYALYPHMTVTENISYGLRLRKTSAKDVAERVAEVAKILDISPLLHRLPKELSGGQRQRVALGRAIVRNPSLFLFDEPLSNLDAELRVVMRTEIASLQKRLATTAVYVTHDQVEAMTMGDRIAVFAPIARSNGINLQQVGTPQELYDQPVNLFVARFIGTPAMAILEGQITGAPGVVDVAGFQVSLPDRFQLGALESQGSRLALGIRPEDVAFDKPENWLTTAKLKGVVSAVELLGHEADVHVSLGGMSVRVKLPGRMALPKREAHVDVFLNLDRLHLFDAQTEQRIPEKCA